MKVYVITTKNSKRLDNGSINGYPLSLPKPEIFYGPLPGDPGTEVPSWFKPRVNGKVVDYVDTTYCCYLSKLNCLKYHLQKYPDEDCLLLEDDVAFHPLFDKIYPSFMAKVPDDWGILWLGGRHIHVAREVTKGVLKPTLIWNAECIVFRAKCLPYVIGELEKGHWPSNHHVDNVFCWLGETLNQYTPLLFIAWQRHGFSHIRNHFRRMGVQQEITYTGLDNKLHTSSQKDYTVYTD